jgi:hypothetical protein
MSWERTASFRPNRWLQDRNFRGSLSLAGAWGKSLGRTYGREGVVASAAAVFVMGGEGLSDADENSRADIVENRSGVVDGVRPLPMHR